MDSLQTSPGAAGSNPSGQAKSTACMCKQTSLCIRIQFLDHLDNGLCFLPFELDATDSMIMMFLLLFKICCLTPSSLVTTKQNQKTDTVVGHRFASAGRHTTAKACFPQLGFHPGDAATHFRLESRTLLSSCMGGWRKILAPKIDSLLQYHFPIDHG